MRPEKEIREQFECCVDAYAIETAKENPDPAKLVNVKLNIAVLAWVLQDG